MALGRQTFSLKLKKILNDKNPVKKNLAINNCTYIHFLSSNLIARNLSQRYTGKSILICNNIRLETIQMFKTGD